LQIVKVLLKSGADPNCENDRGESCLDLAEERDIFKDLFLTYKKDLDQDPSRKRKREADGGMMSGASKGLPETAILLQATGKGSMEGKIPALAAISSSTEMPKDKSESQYEDISEDEEEAVVDGPTVVSPHLDTLVPATASSTQVSDFPVCRSVYMSVCLSTLSEPLIKSMAHFFLQFFYRFFFAISH
jgi:hypothetical protein